MTRPHAVADAIQKEVTAGRTAQSITRRSRNAAPARRPEARPLLRSKKCRAAAGGGVEIAVRYVTAPVNASGCGRDLQTGGCSCCRSTRTAMRERLPALFSHIGKPLNAL